MSYKLKYDSIDIFSKEIARTICDNFFNENDTIDGKNLMTITNSKQTNLFLVKILYKQWKAETAKLQSPYFNFEAEEVKEALSNFMDILSGHIQVNRINLEPLLDKAIYDSTLIHFDPKGYFKDRLLGDFQDEILVSELQDLTKYFKVNADGFFDALTAISDVSINRDELKTNLRERYSEFEAAKPEGFLTDLDATDRLDQLFEQDEPMIAEELDEEEPVIVEQEVALETAESNGVSAINEKFEKTSTTLADELQKKALKDIESSLNLNEKFMFINNLFGGNKEEFSIALKDLESSVSLVDAKSKVEDKYGKDWDMETEEAEAFIEVLERRFG